MWTFWLGSYGQSCSFSLILTPTGDGNPWLGPHFLSVSGRMRFLASSALCSVWKRLSYASAFKSYPPHLNLCDFRWRKHIKNNFYLTLHSRVQSPILNLYLLKDIVSCESRFLPEPKPLHWICWCGSAESSAIQTSSSLQTCDVSWCSLQWRQGGREKWKDQRLKVLGLMAQEIAYNLTGEKLSTRLERARERHILKSEEWESCWLN